MMSAPPRLDLNGDAALTVLSVVLNEVGIKPLCDVIVM
jgi:hypothetical protein